MYPLAHVFAALVVSCPACGSTQPIVDHDSLQLTVDNVSRRVYEETCELWPKRVDTCGYVCGINDSSLVWHESCVDCVNEDPDGSDGSLAGTIVSSFPQSTTQTTYAAEWAGILLTSLGALLAGCLLLAVYAEARYT